MFSLKPPQRGKEAGCRAEGFVADTDTDTDRINSNSNYSLAMIAHLEKFEVRMVFCVFGCGQWPYFLASLLLLYMLKLLT